MARRAPLRALVLVLLIIATVAAYWPVTGHGYVDFDDPEYVRDNHHVRAGLTVEGVKWAFTTNHVSNWHPLTWLSLMLDVELQGLLRRVPGFAAVVGGEVDGLFPGAFHLTNLVLHIVNVLVLVGLMHSLTGAWWRSVMVGGLLAVHPIHVESVAWIAERKDVLSMFFWLLTMWAYVGYARRGGFLRYGLTCILLALGLMAKPMLVTLPVVLVLIDWWPLRRFDEPELNKSGGRWLAIEKVLLLLVALAASIVTVRVQHGVGALQDGVWMPLDVRLANAAVAYIQYVGTLAWPAGLAALYPNPSYITGQHSWPWWASAGALALLAGATIAAWRVRRTRPHILVGWLWFIISMAPVIGIVQIGRHLMADRYAYIPFIGLYFVLSWEAGLFVQRWPRLRPALCGGVCLACVLLATLTHRQTGVWRDSRVLFERAIAVTRDNWIMHNNLADVLERQGQIELGIQHMGKAIRIYPTCAWLHNHLGAMFGRNSQPFEGQLQFERALELDPADVEARTNLGVLLNVRGQFEQAAVQLQNVLDRRPEFAPAHRNLAWSLAHLGRIEDANHHLDKALRLRPDWSDELEATRQLIKAKSTDSD